MGTTLSLSSKIGSRMGTFTRRHEEERCTMSMEEIVGISFFGEQLFLAGS
jgi:hypothetical protein